MKVKRHIFGVAIVGMFGLLAGQSALAVVAVGPNLLNNPGFETGDFSGWSVAGIQDYDGVSDSLAIKPHSGGYSAYFGAVGDFNQIYQNIATTPGDSYDISFWLANNIPLNGSPGISSEAYVDWGRGQLPGSDLLTTSTFGWTYYSYTATATSSTTQVLFAFEEDPAYFNLDDTSVRDLTFHSNIPDQPVGLWMTAATLLGLCAVAGSRRRQEVA
jgi:hypothetical protein